MVRALAGYLHGRDFPLLGAMPRWRAPGMKVLASAVNRLPKRMQEKVYIAGGRMEALPPRKLKDASAERIAEWIAGLYPERKYPAIVIGSANGALTHLWAALGIPWLPQTALIPVWRRGPHPDEPMQDLEVARPWAETLLASNPDVQLHQLHDPNQDRLMIQCMSYFRIKRLVLGRAYEEFIRTRSPAAEADLPAGSRRARHRPCGGAPAARGRLWSGGAGRIGASRPGAGCIGKAGCAARGELAFPGPAGGSGPGQHLRARPALRIGIRRLASGAAWPGNLR